VSYTGGSNTIFKDSIITVSGTVTPVTVTAAPVANFNVTPAVGIATLKVLFTDTSINNPTSWLWDFGDGSISKFKNPTHWYAIAGTYTVTLTATNSLGNTTITRTNVITVT
jgi:PKD repeat protein